MLLLPELLRAQSIKQRQPYLALHLSCCGLDSPGFTWGFDYVEISGSYYKPAPKGAGEIALIVPYSPPGSSIFEPEDIVCHRLSDDRIASRRGRAAVLGEEWLHYAMESSSRVILYENPLRWMLHEMRGAVILDWKAAPVLLAFVPEVVCETRALARRVHAAAKRMNHPPRILHAPPKRRVVHAA